MRTALSHLEDETRNSKTNHTDERREDSSPSRVSIRSMKLRDLLQGTEASLPALAENLEIRHVACDSAKYNRSRSFRAAWCEG
jgi:hypothetical protein